MVVVVVATVVVVAATATEPLAHEKTDLRVGFFSPAQGWLDQAGKGKALGNSALASRSISAATACSGSKRPSSKPTTA